MLFPKRIKNNVKLYQLGKKTGFDFRVIIKLLKIFFKISPDIINTHLNSTIRYAYLVSLFYRKTKYVHTIHSSLYDENIKLFNKLSFLPGFKKKFNNVCISQTIYREFSFKYKNLVFYQIDNGVVQMEKTDNYLDVMNYMMQIEKKKTKLIVAIGGFNYPKNYQMLASVFCKLKQEKRDVHLLMIGGNYLTEKEEINKVNEIKCKNTTLLGVKDNIADYLINADALIMSSRFEGMPIVVLEALSVGLPVITTPAGGVVDIIKNKINGFISKSIEQNDFYKTVTEFLDADMKLIKGIKDNNIKLFRRKYSMYVCAKNYMNLYMNLM